jgi:alpha(1,3/1,4) fucosyltransferase
LLKEKKTQFCCFVASGTIGELAVRRMALFQQIDKWKPVHSAGKVLNNVNYLAPRGLDFLRWISRYRYMICLENSKDSKYITEKPFQSWFAGTVPIYDGSCVNQLNQEAIVNASSNDVLPRLEALEGHPELYESKRNANLTDEPISLISFEERFRKLLRDVSGSK